MFGVFLLLSLVLSAQDYRVTTYNMRDGMPTNQVLDIIQAPDGVLWFASPLGLFSYDGTDWILIEKGITRNVEYHRFRIDIEGTIWALPSNLRYPLVYLKGNEWKAIAPIYKKNELTKFSGSFDIFIRDNQPHVLVSVHYGLLQYYNGNSWKEINIPSELKISRILSIADQNGVFHLATKRGMAIFDREKITLNVQVNAILPDEFVSYVTTDNLNENVLWIMGNEFLAKVIDGRVTIVSDKINISRNHLPSRNNFWLTTDEVGTIYFGDVTSINYLAKNSDTPRVIKYNQSIKNPGSLTMIFDRDKNIWLSDMRGVTKLRQRPFKVYNSENILPTDEVSAIEPLKNGDVLLGQYGSITKLSKGNYKTTKFEGYLDGDLSTSRIMDMLEDESGNIWLIAHGHGIGKYNGDSFEWIIPQDLIVFNTLAEHNGELLVGSSEGIYKFDDSGRLSRYTSLTHFIRRIENLNNNKLGICTGESGLFVIDGDEISQYISDDNTINSTYSAIEHEEYGYLVGTKAGLFLARNDSLVRFTKENFSIGLPTYFISRDVSNHLWFGLNNGVIKWDGKFARRFTESDGLLGAETNRAAGVVDAEGKFWIGTNIAASQYIEKNDLLGEVAPIGKILYLETGSGKKYFQKDRISLKYSDNNVTIHYRGLCFTNEELTKYKLNLTESQNDIIDSFITSEESARYSSLSPGSYTFSLNIINPNELESEETYELNFEIEVPFYSTSWFILLIISGLVIMVWLFFDYIGEKKYSKNLQKRVYERTFELSEKIKQLEEAEGALKKSEEQFRNIFLNSDIGMFQSYVKGGFIIVNPAMVKILGYSSMEKLLAIDLDKDAYKTPEERQDFIKLLRQDGRIVHFERRLKHISGRVVYTNESARLFLDTEGREVIEGTVEDITDKKLAEKAILEAKDKAEKSDKLKSQFLAQMSHEIRTPINSILNFSSLLREELQNKIEDDLQIGFSIMQNAGRRIMRTIDLLLNMSELQTGTYEMNLKQLDLKAGILDPLYLEFRMSAKEKGLELKFIDSTLSNNTWILADEYTIGQIFNNLIDNAIKYTDEGSITIELKNDTDGNLEVSVKDTGIGISEDYLPSLFNPFTQEEEGYTRKYEGNGLGLSLVRHYCELNKATIDVASEKNFGSTFTVLFQKNHDTNSN